MFLRKNEIKVLATLTELDSESPLKVRFLWTLGRKENDKQDWISSTIPKVETKKTYSELNRRADVRNVEFYPRTFNAVSADGAELDLKAGKRCTLCYALLS